MTFGCVLFIILFLHQTTTAVPRSAHDISCLSSCSYIKPQPSVHSTSSRASCLSSCSYIKPQPKPVYGERQLCCLSSCSYIKPQPLPLTLFIFWLFIILFLHQTTTADQNRISIFCCLSSCSYIKPQLATTNNFTFYVVYHLVPTSNHN